MLALVGSTLAFAYDQSGERPIVATEAYSWIGDTIFQDRFKAWAVSPYEIRSDYYGRPGYFMPVEQVWKRKNDLSAYPTLETDNKLHQAIYNMGLDEMVNAVEPDTTLRTGKEWAGVWTRDVSYSIILAMAALQPEASMISLMHKVNPSGQIIQDTGSGGAWPVSTDRMVWILAAWEIYKVTGDKDWLKKVYPIVARSLDKDLETTRSDSGLIKGETSFIDWREQSYPRWMQTVDISQSEAHSTNVVFSAALKAASSMAELLGKKKEATRWNELATKLSENISSKLWMPEKGYHAMYSYGRDSLILNPRAESLGEALGILYDVTPRAMQSVVSSNMPQTPFGAPVFYPQIADIPNYHNNALWPFEASYMTLAHAKAGNEEGVVEGIGSIFRPAALFATNKENLNLDNGDYFTELNSSNMLWSLSGNLALTQRILFGINFEPDGLLFKPFVPATFAGIRTLRGFPYRGGRLNITIDGFGDTISEIYVDGKKTDSQGYFSASQLKKIKDIRIVLDNEPIERMGLNRVANKRAPLTPTAWIEDDELRWNPIEYIAGYEVIRNGVRVGKTRQTSFKLTEPGEWQVIGVDTDGVESFASEPRSNRKRQTIQFPKEGAKMSSLEISYPSLTPVEGFSGTGFRETDTSSEPIQVSVEVPEGGDYILSVRYANGNGPINTENKCGVRTLKINGEKVGTLVFPHRGVGNWNDWGYSNHLKVNIPAGESILTIEYQPEDENMNIITNHALLDCIVLEKR